MRGFLSKKWHGIPVGIISVLLLAGVVAAAGYIFLSGTISVEVKEPMKVEYSWDGTTWVEFEENFDLAITGAKAGDSWVIGIRVTNSANNPITATLTYALTSGPAGWSANPQWITLSGSDLVNVGLVIPANDSQTRNLTGKIANDAPPGDYVVAVNFMRS